MPPKRFEGKFGIPASHPVESLLTSASYRLPESLSIKEIELQVKDITLRVNKALESKGLIEQLTENEIKVLTLKLVRHYEDNGESVHLDVATMVDALVESPRFLKSDRGSMAKLFELHEIKTLQKIAEIRRKKAEQTHSEGLNPYENLFETSSSKYYLARLLSMPHLEDESTYMDHCVGTSTSYINKVKKGEVEIFSFRDKNTDKPVVTIEYDTRSHRLLQVKKYDDALPTLVDSFTPDLIEAIELLSTTLNDKGEIRTIASREAVHLRQLLTLKDKKEPFTRDELCFLYEVDEKIQGFDIGREPFIAELRKDRNTEEDMLTIFECTKDQIAHVPSEITESTKAYVGQLEPGFFQKLPETLEHVYTSFPENKIRRESVEIGGNSKEELISLMQAQGINISDYAESMMENPDFITGANREEAKLVRLTVADMGFKTSATIDQIYERAQALGLELCPPDTGPNYRLQYKDQPLEKWVRIGMKQITDSDGGPRVFGLGRDDGGLWLSGHWAQPARGWDPRSKFVFRLRKSES